MKRHIFLLLLILGCSVTKAWGVDPTALIKESEDRIRSATAHSEITMIIESRRWKRTLKLECWYKEGIKARVIIHSPPKEEGIISLKVGDALWNYFPNLNRSIRVHPSMIFQSWMGSDFTNDDFVHESSLINDYTHTIEGIDNTDSGEAYRIILTPKHGAGVVWDRIIYLISKTDHLPVRQDFFDGKGNLIRTLTFYEIKEMDGKTLPTLWIMKYTGKEGKTILQIDKIKFRVEIPDDLFSLTGIEK
ncbi:MAG: outer membrane lipoprotein-sorting protein [Nitrospinae bacterium]|nr:outer membrane lipoprotein-sorting protein [Nitrospinota bacterium]